MQRAHLGALGKLAGGKFLATGACNAPASKDLRERPTIGNASSHAYILARIDARYFASM
jgi:hypothetical protein